MLEAENEWTPAEKLIDGKMIVTQVSSNPKSVHYTCTIPWKGEGPNLVNNINEVLARQRRTNSSDYLVKKGTSLKEIDEKFQDQIKKGYIEKKHKKQQKSLHLNIKKFLSLFLFSLSLSSLCVIYPRGRSVHSSKLQNLCGVDSKYYLQQLNFLIIRVADPVHFQPDPAPDPDPANQNFKTGSRIRILDPTGT